MIQPLLHEAPLIETEGLGKRYRIPASGLFERSRSTVALDDVNLTIDRGQSVAIVGESGSGKTTLLKLLLGLSRPTAGTVRFDGNTVNPSGDRLMWLRRRTGIVFQDPYSSFNPRRTIGQTVAEPLIATGAPGDHHRMVSDMLAKLELPEGAAERYPHEFSGGQRQRIAIARALVHGPELLVADEPVSALDVLVRDRLLGLLSQLRDELGLTLVTVTHDLSVVPRLADRVMVLKDGRIVETGEIEQIFTAPRETYTRELIESLPRLP